MKRHPHFASLLLAMIIITACSPAKPTPTAFPSSAAIKTSAPASVEGTEASPLAFTPTCETTSEPEDIQLSLQTTYQFNISLNYGEHSLVVSEIIGYTNNTGETLSYLTLLVPPAYSEDAFHLVSLQMDSTHQHATTRLEEGILHIQLNPALKADEKLEISLIFHLTPPQKNSTFGYTKRQLLLADWYPFPTLPRRSGLAHKPARRCRGISVLSPQSLLREFDDFPTR